MKLPAALLVGGTDTHRRRVFVRDLVAKCSLGGWDTHPIDGADHSGLQSLMSFLGVLSTKPTLAVITRPEKLAPKDLADHLREPNPYLTLLLVSEADKPTGGVLDGFPPAQMKIFPLPPFYKLDDHAADYARECAKARGADLPDGLARALVKRVGNDLGVVYYEVDKVTRYAATLGVRVLEPAHLKGTIAPLMELDGSTVADALGTRNVKILADELARYKNSKKGDPTIELCGRTLTPMVLRWLQASYLHSKGSSPASAAGRVGSSPWYWEHKILPAARTWGVEGCRNLIEAIARAQSAVFDGAISPWSMLESSLLRLAL